MNLFTKDGTAKIVRECTYPLTGLRCVRRVYTGRAIFDIDSDGGTVRVRETFRHLDQRSAATGDDQAELTGSTRFSR
jgi:acyl CoA:acetate/3-ketoacid CoA transferase beta subunit